MVKWDLEVIPPLIERESIQVRYNSTYIWQHKGLCELYAIRHSLILGILFGCFAFQVLQLLMGHRYSSHLVFSYFLFNENDLTCPEVIMRTTFTNCNRNFQMIKWY